MTIQVRTTVIPPKPPTRRTTFTVELGDHTISAIERGGTVTLDGDRWYAEIPTLDIDTVIELLFAVKAESSTNVGIERKWLAEHGTESDPLDIIAVTEPTA